MELTFFKALSNIENSVDKKEIIFKDPNVQRTFKKLISFTESGIYTKSETEKFIGANFRLSIFDMTDLWNNTNFSNKKASNTFRGQVSLLGSYICSIFQLSPDEFNDAFVNEDYKTLKRVEEIVDSFSFGETDISERFKAIASYMPSLDSVKSFDLSECEKEFELLRTFDDAVISKFFEGIDFDKLAYLLSLCSKPLTSFEYIELPEKKRKVKICHVDDSKLAFCQRLQVIKPKKIKPEENIKIEIDSVVEDEKPVVKQETIVKKEEIPYDLCITSDLANIITEVINTFEREDKAYVQKGQVHPDVLKGDDGGKASRFLNLYTVEGFRRSLETINKYCFAEEIKNRYKKDDD